MELKIEPGDKVTLVTKDAVLICTVNVVRARADPTPAQGEADGTELRLETNSIVPLSASDV
jgi:hypothetical protein